MKLISKYCNENISLIANYKITGYTFSYWCVEYFNDNTIFIKDIKMTKIK